MGKRQTEKAAVNKNRKRAKNRINAGRQGSGRGHHEGEASGSWLHHCAIWLTDHLHLARKSTKNKKLCEDLQALSPGERDPLRNYMIRKTEGLLKLLLILIPLFLLLLLISVFSRDEGDLSSLLRPNEGSRQETLTVTSPSRGTTEINLELSKRVNTVSEAEALLDQAAAEIREGLLADNESADEVRSSLFLPEHACQGAVSVSWTSFPYGNINDDGTIAQYPQSEEGIVVELQAILSAESVEGNRTRILEQAVRILPPLLDDQASFWQRVRFLLKSTDEKYRTKEEVPLPDALDGEALSWQRKKDSAYAGLWVILLVIPFLLYVHSDQTIHEKAISRQEQLLLDYAPLLWKMAMLLGAGLTIRGTFYRIAEEYRAQKAAEGKKHHPHFAYEEIQLTCIDLQNGMREALAYEAFGRRCGLPGYIKLGSLLSLNLQKGSAGLIGLLEEEAREAMEERKSTAKKMGERAGTKLLLPMTAMLGVVLMILMVPAFLSM